MGEMVGVPLDTKATPEFTVEDISVGAYAHGFGTSGDGRPYAFRVIRRTIHVEVYREDLDHTVPNQEDVAALAEASITDIDLNDERSIVALVRDLVHTAEPVEREVASESTTVRAFLSRISSVIDSI
ncbi:hypothetical protein [Antrihabitans stalagmiti]|nr:hypothetical protein [Antrihabitans stalagmiti]